MGEWDLNPKEGLDNMLGKWEEGERPQKGTAGNSSDRVLREVEGRCQQKLGAGPQGLGLRGIQTCPQHMATKWCILLLLDFLH